jgi:hypothetical protein
MSVILIDAEMIKDANRVKQYAEEHPYHMPEMMKRVAEELPSPGDNPAFVGYIKPFLRYVFTIEESKPGVMYRTVSVSNSNKQRPSPMEVGIVMDLLGFKHRLSEENQHHIMEEGFEPLGDPFKPEEMRYAIVVKEEIK